MAGIQAVYNSSGLQYYRHADWLGSSRFAGTPSGSVQYSLAYAPFGETYSEAGTVDRSFTGQTQDVIAGPTGIYDFLWRQHAASQGRWLVPDPAGLAAVDLTTPQTWNRYAYLANNPLNKTDPQGLCAPGDNNNCDSGANEEFGPTDIGRAWANFMGAANGSINFGGWDDAYLRTGFGNNYYNLPGRADPQGQAEAAYLPTAFRYTGMMYGKSYDKTFASWDDYANWSTGIAALPESQAYAAYMLDCAHSTTPCMGGEQVTTRYQGPTGNYALVGSSLNAGSMAGMLPDPSLNVKRYARWTLMVYERSA